MSEQRDWGSLVTQATTILGATSGLLAAISAFAPQGTAFLALGYVGWLILAALLLTAAATIVLARRRRRSRLLEPDALRLDPGNSAHLLGREAEIEYLARACDANLLVFLSGDSGAGKSALVRAGLLPRLLGDPRWRPVLLDMGDRDFDRGLATALARSFDQIMIGWLWGPAALGLYERTTRLLLLPVNTINAPVYAAGMPALSRLVEQPERYRAMFRQIVQKLGLLTMPVFAVVALTADWMVEILFGPAWTAAVPLAALFSVSAIFLPVLLTMGLLYLTLGRTAELLQATLIDAGICLLAIGAGLPWGGVGVAAALAVAGLALRTPLSLWLATRRGPVRKGDVWRAIAPPASAAIAAAVTVALVRACVPRNLSVESVAAVGAAASAVIILVLLLWPETRREIRSGVQRAAILVRRQIPPVGDA